jgi:hypothetical protein
MPQRQCRAGPQKPCSAPPKRRPPAYDHRPGAAPGRTTRSHRTRPDPHDEPVRVILPDEPPWLTPAAARALLWILLKAHAQLTEQKETQMPNPATLTARPKEDTR